MQTVSSKPTIDNLPDGVKEARCHCGHLMAKLRKGGVELKCKRCKRIIHLPLMSKEYHEFFISACPV